MKTADFKDKRLDKRFAQVLSALAAKPTASIPAACNGFAETMAAYRFFDNEKVTFEDVLEPHQHATRERMAAQPVVLVAQDTTEIDLTRPDQQVTGAGPLDDGTRRGAFLHELHAFTPDGTPLGTVDAFAWTRGDEPLAPSQQRAKERKKAPIEGKESRRWLDTLQTCREVAEELPNPRIVALADSEGDIYELLVAAQQEPRRIDWIVRGCQNRALAGDPSYESPERLPASQTGDKDA